MRFSVERGVLAEAVAWASRALPARPVVPVLAGLLLRVTDTLTISCFDYEVFARVRVPAEVTEPGTALVPGRLLAEITRSLPGRPVEFSDDPDGIELTCGNASFTLVALDAEEYPEPPHTSGVAGTVDGGDLAAAIGQVAPAASRDDTLPMLTGVNIEVDADTMTLVATDRYRLAVRRLRWAPARPEMRASFLVPARTLVDAARVMTPGSPVTIRLRGAAHRSEEGAGHGEMAGDDPVIGFEHGDRLLATRLIAGEFIGYRSRFPREFGCRADIPAGPFLEAVSRVALVAERGTAVRLAFGGGRVAVEAGTVGQARARETVPATFDGAAPVIAFNPRYLLDGLAAAMMATADGARAADDAVAAHRVADGDGVAADDADGTDGADDDEAAGRGPYRHDWGAGDVDRDGAAGGRAHEAMIRLEFTSRSKPAVVTGVPGGDHTGNRDAPGEPDFRYLVVPLRVPDRQ